jgi:sarcosine oxidase subunit gamma
MADQIGTTLTPQANLAMLRRSPLAGTARQLMDRSITGARSVRVSEWRFATMVSVRVDPASPAAAALGDALGAALPRRCGEVSSSGKHSVLWLGPDEWLVVSHASADELVPALVEAAGATTAAIVDVSANRTILELNGAAARGVLEKGCPTDLHPRAFGPGQAVTTTLARVPLLLWQVGPQSYRLLPRASFAEYVAAWLLDAMQEFGTLVGEGTS